MVLLVASLGGVAFLALAAKVAVKEYQGEYVAALLLALAFALALNAYYLFETRPPDGSHLTRFGRMWSLWLASKERELERRANPAD